MQPNYSKPKHPQKKKCQAKVFSWISFEGCSMLLRADAKPLFSKLIVISQSIFLFKSQAPAPTKATKQISSTNPKIPLLPPTASALGTIIYFFWRCILSFLKAMQCSISFKKPRIPKRKLKQEYLC
jgi:hypothetical protein